MSSTLSTNKLLYRLQRTHIIISTFQYATNDQLDTKINGLAATLQDTHDNFKSSLDLQGVAMDRKWKDIGLAQSATSERIDEVTRQLGDMRAELEAKLKVSML